MRSRLHRTLVLISSRIPRQKGSHGLVISIRSAAVLLLSVSVRLDPSTCYAPTHSHSFGVRSYYLKSVRTARFRGLSDYRCSINQIDDARPPPACFESSRRFVVIRELLNTVHLLVRNCEHESLVVKASLRNRGFRFRSWQSFPSVFKCR